ncbi:uncharacterized protein LOC130046427 [Ostrea edulis]|uniref:uncharacterized protein LOC130046427 n=1 Tax=Ostrea edulis TaxID=37623 RepID=UPI0024AFF322|nr:uncharacterized protein LOC130046427 [Ostrea edulis]
MQKNVNNVKLMAVKGVNPLVLTYLFVILCLEKWTVRAYCDGAYKPCCAGEMWNSTLNLCIECPLGFHGANCSRSCSFPYYGKKCLDGECTCSKELCNFATGCMETTLNAEVETTSTITTKGHTFLTLNWELSSPNTVTIQRKEETASSNDIFKNPILLGIFGVNFIFLVLILTYCCKRLRNPCFSKVSQAQPREEMAAKAHCPYEELDVQVYNEIENSYNVLTLTPPDLLIETPSLSSNGSSKFTGSGNNVNFAYDDIANVQQDHIPSTLPKSDISESLKDAYIVMHAPPTKNADK